MNNASDRLQQILGALTESARSRALNDSEWAASAGLRKETLSRLRRRSSCDFATLESLAETVGSRLVAVTSIQPESTPDGHFPLHVYRDYEEKLLELCAAPSLEALRWAALGPRFFMAGLAVMLASNPDVDREGLLALAESLHPGVSEPAVFAHWLRRSPVRPSRFLPLLEERVRHAA
jgi:DNA-binding phage protein